MKNEGTHTPGPWELQETPEQWWVRAPGRTFLASVPKFYHSTTDALVEVDARLIVSAPELLDALYHVLGALDSPDNTQGGVNRFSAEQVERAREYCFAAIARAEGR